MVKGKTKTGFEFEINENAFNDMEVLDALSALNKGEVFAISDLCNKLFGNEQKKRLYDHIREEDGRIPLEKFSDELKDVMELSGTEGKN